MQIPTGASRLVFILAHPAGHVSAPRYYSPYFRESGLDWHMVPLDIAPEHLAETIRTLAKSRSVAWRRSRHPYAATRSRFRKSFSMMTRLFWTNLQVQPLATQLITVHRLTFLGRDFVNSVSGRNPAALGFSASNLGTDLQVRRNLTESLSTSLG
jgi:hypothetical protein